MKAFLMHESRDFDLNAPLSQNANDLTQDLELNRLFAAMAGGDQFLFQVAGKAILSSLTDAEEIVYRQQILTDCLEHADVVRQMYQIAVEAIQAEKKVYSFFGRYPAGTLRSAVEKLDGFVEMLKRLRHIADEHGSQFQSDGFVRLFGMLTEELSDEYFHGVSSHLKRLRFDHGVLISAELGKGNRARDYVLRRPLVDKRRWLERILAMVVASPYSFQVPDRDEAGARALSELKDRGLNLAANALAQSSDHILSFFTMLQAELAFYLGCLNLSDRLRQIGEPTCMPLPLPIEQVSLSAQGLYDVCLALRLQHGVTPNDLAADGKALLMITGANQGGKSTFLRSVGLAYLMMQCGMFVAAETLSASIGTRVFTHYRREEDPTMKSGKLDEELSRMSAIADQIMPNSVLLCNESFSSTNEREGSQIAREIVRAMLEAGVRVLFVTHLYDLAEGFYGQHMDNALFVRAERRPDGKRTFRVQEGEPLPTSYGQDLYREILGPPSHAA
ncbi:MAG: MutS-related protein [Candidatus Dormibacteraceae bacterium]